MRILVISPVPTHPTQAGNCVRILNLIQVLEELGHDIHFLHVTYQAGNSAAMLSCFGNRFHSYNYQRPWRKYRFLGLPIPDRISRHIVNWGWLSQHIDQFYDFGLDEYIHELHKKYDYSVAIVEYVFFSAALNALPSTVHKLIDTHDVYTNRHHLLRRSGLAVDWFFTTKREEAKGLLRADCILAIQNEEQKTLESIIQNKRPVNTVGHFLKPVQLPTPVKLKTVLIVGSNNPLNVRYTQSFIDSCWKKFVEGHSECELIIAGGVCSQLGSSINCRLLGFVHDLEEAYTKADLVVNPLLTGTGLKIKSLEALSHGKVLLAASAGLEGLHSAVGKAAILADGFIEMRNELTRLANNPHQLHDMSHAAIRFAKEYQQQQIAALNAAISVSL